MKIAYVAYYSSVGPTGVWEKILGQRDALACLGHQVRLFAVDSSGATRSRSGRPVCVIAPSCPQTNLMRIVGFQLDAVLRLREQLSGYSPDVIYLRHPLYRPRLGKALSSLAPFVVEINGNPLRELRLKGQMGNYLIERILGKSVLGRAAGFVGVTRESVEYARRTCNDESLPAIVIGNGVDCESVPFLMHCPLSDKIHIAYVGSRSVYSGIDRIVRAMQQATIPVVHLHLIGDAWSSEPGVNALVADGCATDHGYVAPEQLGSVLAGMDVCIGPLGIHRKGQQEGSPLKVRRYIAHGIPTVISFDDTDLEGRHDFLLKVPADDSALNLGQLISFGRYAREHPGIRRQAREYAEKTLDYRVKMRQLVGFIEGVVRSGKH